MAKKPSSNNPTIHPSSPAHLRDAEGIGKSWGIDYYKQRIQRQKQLQDIRDVMKRDDFPKPVKGKGYPRDAVVAYGFAHIKMDAKSRGFEWVEKIDGKDAGGSMLAAGKKSSNQQPASSPDIPPAETPAEVVEAPEAGEGQEG